MFLTKRFYMAGLVVIALFVSGYFLPVVFTAGKAVLACLALAVATDGVMLWRRRKGANAERYCAPRFSNGDFNDVRLVVESVYPFPVNIDVIDEIPVIFQRRDILFKIRIKSGGREVIRYKLRPVERGEYGFGSVLLYVTTVLGMVSRRIKCASAVDIAVYPSYVMLHRYEIMAIHNHLTETGIKKKSSSEINAPADNGMKLTVDHYKKNFSLF